MLGSIKQVYSTTWPTLSELNFETGEQSDNIKQINNNVIEISGFIVPFEMDEYVDEVTEFLLVPDPLACIHVPPPPNQMIIVTMPFAIPVDMDFRGVTIEGTLSVFESENIHGYQLKGHAAKEANIEYEDPLMELLNN